MTRHQELLRALPPSLSLPQVACLLRVQIEEVLSATTRLELALDEDLRVRTGPLLADLGVELEEAHDDAR